ncbi:MAG TPA: hypothetical protein VGK33_17860 [Chloroflexota bacterium]
MPLATREDRASPGGRRCQNCAAAGNSQPGARTICHANGSTGHAVVRARLAPADPELATFESALARATERVRIACQLADGWLQRTRLGLLALLDFFDEEPRLATVLVVHSAHGGEALRARRSEALAGVASLLDLERAAARSYPPRLTAPAVVNGVLGILYERLTKPDAGALVDLSQPLMSFIVMPFLGAAAARRELARRAELSTAIAARRWRLGPWRRPGLI